jgi:hypothetical protein
MSRAMWDARGGGEEEDVGESTLSLRGLLEVSEEVEELQRVAFIQQLDELRRPLSAGGFDNALAGEGGGGGGDLMQMS